MERPRARMLVADSAAAVMAGNHARLDLINLISCDRELGNTAHGMMHTQLVQPPYNQNNILLGG